jgi:hypothetical protein
MSVAVLLGIEHYLGNSLPVAQIDEYQPPVIASAQRPPHQDHFPACIRAGQRAAIIGALPLSKKIYHADILLKSVQLSQKLCQYTQKGFRHQGIMPG